MDFCNKTSSLTMTKNSFDNAFFIGQNQITSIPIFEKSRSKLR